MSVVILGFVTVGGGAVEIRRVSAWVSLVTVNETLIFLLYNTSIKQDIFLYTSLPWSLIPKKHILLRKDIKIHVIFFTKFPFTRNLSRLKMELFIFLNFGFFGKGQGKETEIVMNLLCYK